MVPLYFLLPAVSAFSPDSFALVGDATRYGSYGMIMVMLFFAPLAHFKSGSLTSLWSLVAFLLYTRWFGALNLYTAPYLSAFQISLGKTLSPTNLFNISDGKEIPQEKIKKLGVENALFLRNSGQLLLCLAGLAVVFVVAMTFGKEKSCFHNLKRKMQYTVVILAALLSFQDLLIYAFLQVQGLEMASAVGVISALLSFSFLCFALLFTLFIPIVLYKGLANTQSISYSKWEILTKDMKSDISLPRCQYFFIFLLQRWVSATLFVLLYSLPELQLSIILTLEAAVLVWMIYSRPYIRAVDNAVVMMQQATVCALLLFEGCYYVSWSDSSDVMLAFAYICAYWLGILLCLVRFAFGFYRKQAVFPLEPLSASTYPSTAELKSSPTKAIDDEDQIVSEKPNNQYNQLNKPSPPQRVKSLSKVQPDSPFRLDAVKKQEETASRGRRVKVVNG